MISNLKKEKKKNQINLRVYDNLMLSIDNNILTS